MLAYFQRHLPALSAARRWVRRSWRRSTPSRRSRARSTTFGFLNPLLYAMGRHGGDFDDVTTGQQRDRRRRRYAAHEYDAGPGYDMASGLGSPDPATFLPALCDGPATATATPTTPARLVARGPLSFHAGAEPYAAGATVTVDRTAGHRAPDAASAQLADLLVGGVRRAERRAPGRSVRAGTPSNVATLTLAHPATPSPSWTSPSVGRRRTRLSSGPARSRSPTRSTTSSPPRRSRLGTATPSAATLARSRSPATTPPSAARGSPSTATVRDAAGRRGARRRGDRQATGHGRTLLSSHGAPTSSGVAVVLVPRRPRRGVDARSPCERRARRARSPSPSPTPGARARSAPCSGSGASSARPRSPPRATATAGSRLVRLAGRPPRRSPCRTGSRLAMADALGPSDPARGARALARARRRLALRGLPLDERRPRRRAPGRRRPPARLARRRPDRRSTARRGCSTTRAASSRGAARRRASRSRRCRARTPRRATTAPRARPDALHDARPHRRRGARRRRRRRRRRGAERRPRDAFVVTTTDGRVLLVAKSRRALGRQRPRRRARCSRSTVATRSPAARPRSPRGLGFTVAVTTRNRRVDEFVGTFDDWTAETIVGGAAGTSAPAGHATLPSLDGRPRRRRQRHGDRRRAASRRRAALVELSSLGVADPWSSYDLTTLARRRPRRGAGASRCPGARSRCSCAVGGRLVVVRGGARLTPAAGRSA